MAKRSRGSTSRPGQRPPLQRQAARPAARRQPQPPRPPRHPDPTTLTDEEEARAAELEAAIVAEEQAAEAASKKATAHGRRRPSPVRADVEHRDLGRRGVRLRRPRRPAHRDRRWRPDPHPAGPLARRPPHRVQRRSNRTVAVARRHRDTIGAMPSARRPTGARPEALFQPPPERQPLAARMRPRNLDEFVGQEHLVGERGPLRRGIARGHLSSLLLWGPPGTGKTSLARLLAAEIGAHFTSLSAVMSGVVEVRATIAEAQERLDLHGTRSVLFLDEIHRFNKAQQDALLPHVEDGTVTLIGATTENPYFEVNSALLSRMRVWRLEALTDDEVGGRRPPGARRRGARAGRIARAGRRRRSQRRRLRAPRLARRRRRPGGAQRPRGRDGAGRIRGDPRHERPRQPAPRGRRGRRPAARPRLRPRRRRPLRHGLGVHQEPARQRPGRRPLLAGGDDRGRRGPEVHRPAADHQRVGGRRERGPAGASVAVAAAQALDWIGLPEAQYALAQATVFIATAPKSDRSGGRTGRRWPT